MDFCHGNNICVWAGVVVMKNDFFPCQTWPFLRSIGFFGGVDSAYFHCFTAVLSLGYSSGPKFHHWSQTSAKYLVGCTENGSNFARTFPLWCVYDPMSRAAAPILRIIFSLPILLLKCDIPIQMWYPYSFSYLSHFRLTILHDHFMHFCDKFWDSSTFWHSR